MEMMVLGMKSQSNTGRSGDKAKRYKHLEGDFAAVRKAISVKKTWHVWAEE